MKLKDLKFTIDQMIKMHPRSVDDEVVINLNNISIGPRASTGINDVYKGSDWEHGKVIIAPSTPLVKYRRVSSDDVRLRAKEVKENVKKVSPTARVTFEYGFFEGYIYGSTKLIEEQKVTHTRQRS